LYGEDVIALLDANFFRLINYEEETIQLEICLDPAGAIIVKPEADMLRVMLFARS
jgi:hypothetical protein